MRHLRPSTRGSTFARQERAGGHGHLEDNETGLMGGEAGRNLSVYRIDTGEQAMVGLAMARRFAPIDRPKRRRELRPGRYARTYGRSDLGWEARRIADNM